MSVDVSTLQINADSRDISKANIDLRNLESTAGRTERSTKQMGSQFNYAADQANKMGSRISNLIKIMGPLLVGGMVARGMQSLASDFLDNADKIAKMSQSVGLSVERLSALSHAADLSGTNIDSLSKGVEKLSKGILDSKDGIGEADKAFEKLGISATDTEGKMRSSGDVLNDIADKFSRMEDGSQKTALAMQLFGRSGTQLIPMLNAGSKGLSEMEAEAGKLGITLDTKTAQQAERINDQMDRLGKVVKGVGMSIMENLLPYIEETVDDMMEWIGENQDFIDQDIPMYLNAMVEGLGHLTRALVFVAEKTEYAAKWWAEFIYGPSDLKGVLAERLEELEELKEKRDHIASGRANTGRGQFGYEEDTEELDKQIRLLEGQIKYLQETIEQRKISTDNIKEETGANKDNVKVVEDILDKTKTIVEINEEYAKSLKDIEIGYMNLDAINMTDKEYRMQNIDEEAYNRTKEILDKIKRDKENAIKDEERLKEESLREQERAYEKHLEEQEREWKRVHDNMHEYGVNVITDLLDDGKLKAGNIFDSIEDMFKRMLANMIMEATMTNIFKPIMGQLAGSTIGNMFGLPGTSDGGSSLSSIFGLGKNLLGGSDMLSTITSIGDFGNAIWTSPSSMAAMASGGVSQGMAYPGAISGAVPEAFSGVGNLGSLGNIGSIGAMIPFAAMASFVVPKILEGLLGDKPKATFQSDSDPLARTTVYERMTRDNFDMGTGPTEQAATTKLGDKSQNFDFWIRWVDVDDAETQAQVRDYFDSVFMSYEELFDISMNDVLKESSFMSGTGRLDKGGTFEDMFSGVFDNMLDELLTAVFPDSEMVEKTVTKVTGSRNIADPYSKGEFSTELVYEDFTYEVSEMAETFNKEFFQAIAPEGGTEWEGFARFGSIVKENDGFMEKFNNRIENLGETAEEAFLNLEIISSVMSEAESVYDSLSETSNNNDISNLITSWDLLIDKLKEASATAEEVARAEDIANVTIGSNLTGLTSESIFSGLQSGQSVEEAVSNILVKAVNTAENDILAQSAFEDYTDLLEEAGQAARDSGGDLQAWLNVIKSSDLILSNSTNSLETFYEILSKGSADAKESRNNAEANYLTAASNYLSALESEYSEIQNRLIDARNTYISTLQQEQSILEENARKAQSNYQQGLSLADTLISTIGDEDDALELLNKKREYELSIMDDSLHPLQNMIWSLEDASVAFEDVSNAIESVRGTIDSIMGSTDSVQSKDYMENRYNELFLAAQEDPSKVGEFSDFSTKYIDFMADYGDPKTRENVLKDLFQIEEQYLNEQIENENQTNIHLVNIDDVLDEIYNLEESYLQANQSRDNSWYLKELDSFDDISSIAGAKDEYLDALSALETFEVDYTDDINELKTLLGQDGDLASLLQAFLDAQEIYYESGQDDTGLDNWWDSESHLKNIIQSLGYQYDIYGSDVDYGDWLGKAGDFDTADAFSDAVAEWLESIHGSTGSDDGLGNSNEYLDFDEDLYLQNKKAVWESNNPGQTRTIEDFEESILNAYGSLQDHFINAGQAEGVSPFSGIPNSITDLSGFELTNNGWIDSGSSDSGSSDSGSDSGSGSSDNDLGNTVDQSWREPGVSNYSGAWGSAKDLYDSIGRATPSFGEIADWYDIILQDKYSDWSYNKFREDEFMPAVRDFVADNPNDPASLEVIDHFGTANFNTGGSFAVNGPSGIDNLMLPQMRVTAGEIVNISRPDVLSELLTQIKSLSGSNNTGDVQVKVYVGNKEIEDIAVETLRSNYDAQKIIKRVAYV